MDQLSEKDVSKIKYKFNDLHKNIMSVKSEINNLVFGQEEVIDQILISLLSNGHAGSRVCT